MSYSINITTARLLHSVGAAAVIAGGMIAAFCAHNPSRDALWLSAYLVLVVGVIQFSIGTGIAQFVTKSLSKTQAIIAPALFNIGSAAIIIRTLTPEESTLSHVFIVDFGSAIFLASLLIYAHVARGYGKSWHRAIYTIAVGCGIIGALAGITLAQF